MRNSNMGFLRAAGMAAALSMMFGATGSVAGAQASEHLVSEASAAVTPAAFVTDLVASLRSLAEASQDGDEARTAGFRDVLSQDMATSRMKRFLLSREQRLSASEDDLAAYNALFADYIAAAYADSIDELVSRTIEINDVVERRPGDFIVRSKLYAENGDERAGIDWRILEIDGVPVLVDVMVDGLSFNVERRAQFTAIIQKDGFEALLAHMRQQIETGDALD